MIAALQPAQQHGSASTPASVAPALTPTEAARHRKLADAAQQFEAIFLQQMLKPLSAMSQEDGTDDTDSSDNAGDDKVGDDSTYQSLGVEAMAKAVSAAGGLGIAHSIVAMVEKESGQKHKGAEKTGQL